MHPRAFFLTIVVVQNVPLLMTESSMATGCDVTESDVTGSDVIRPKVGDSNYKWGLRIQVKSLSLKFAYYFHNQDCLTCIYPFFILWDQQQCTLLTSNIGNE